MVDKKSIFKRIRGAIQNHDAGALAGIFDACPSADMADVIEHLEPDERVFIFTVFTVEQAGEVLAEIEPPIQKQILAGLDDQLVSDILEQLPSDDAVDILGNLSEERAEDVLEMSGPDVSRELEKLLQYGKETAGGIMDLAYVAIPETSTVGEVIDLIREKKHQVKNLYHVWVLDHLDRLSGVVSLKDLLIEAPGRKITDIMNPEVISVPAGQDQEEVARLFKKHDLVNMPVVDDSGLLLGRITHDDIIDVIEKEVDEDLSLMTGAMGHEIAEESFLKISRARLPWLITGVAGGIVAAVVINQFETTLEKIIALSFFLPVIMGMGGNTGTQASTIVVRGLATGDVSLVNIRKRLWLEMKVALINGIACGGLLGLIVGWWLSDYALGSIVALAGVLVVLNSGFTGSAVPIVLNKCGIDPALATGPFITTLNDILGLVIYLGLVTLFLGSTI
ncbi:MAG: magnesium transporter [Desulfotignum sp.]|nr:magnesium transporter [Desulfotignum sp.]